MQVVSMTVLEARLKEHSQPRENRTLRRSNSRAEPVLSESI